MTTTGIATPSTPSTFTLSSSLPSSSSSSSSSSGAPSQPGPPVNLEPALETAAFVTVKFYDNVFRVPTEQIGEKGFAHLKALDKFTNPSHKKGDIDSYLDRLITRNRRSSLQGYWLVLILLARGDKEEDVVLRFAPLLPESPSRIHSVISMTAGVLRVGLEAYLEVEWPVHYADDLDHYNCIDDDLVDCLVRLINKHTEKVTRTVIDELTSQAYEQIHEKRKKETQEILDREAVWSIWERHPQWPHPSFPRPSKEELAQNQADEEDSAQAGEKVGPEENVEEREKALEKREKALKKREAALKKREAALKKRVVALKRKRDDKEEVGDEDDEDEGEQDDDKNDSDYDPELSPASRAKRRAGLDPS